MLLELEKAIKNSKFKCKSELNIKIESRFKCKSEEKAKRTNKKNPIERV